MIKAIPPPLFSARTKPKQPPPGLPRIYDDDNSEWKKKKVQALKSEAKHQKNIISPL